MCGRYVLRAAKKAITDWFGVDPEHLPEFGPSFNIAPQTFQPVVRLSPATGEREIVLMRWGLLQPLVEDGPLLQPSIAVD